VQGDDARESRNVGREGADVVDLPLTRTRSAAPRSSPGFGLARDELVDHEPAADAGVVDVAQNASISALPGSCFSSCVT